MSNLVKLKDVLAKKQATFVQALPKGIDPDRMIQTALTLVGSSPGLQKCDPVAVCGEIVKACQLGLELDPLLGRAYLLVFRNKPQLIVGYKGYIELAFRGGKVTRFDAQCVYEKDQFDYQYGTKPYLHHKPARGEDRGAMIATYAVVHMRDAEPLFHVSELSEIEDARNRSPSAKADFSPWKSDYDAMARKTAVRRIAPLIPMSAALTTAFAMDEQPDAQVVDVTVDQVKRMILPGANPAKVEPVVEPDPEPRPELEPEPDGHPLWPRAEAAGMTELEFDALQACAESDEDIIAEIEKLEEKA